MCVCVFMQHVYSLVGLSDGSKDMITHILYVPFGRRNSENVVKVAFTTTNLPYARPTRIRIP